MNKTSTTTKAVGTELHRCGLCKSGTNNSPFTSDEGSVYVCNSCRKLKYVDGLYEHEMVKVIGAARVLIEQGVYQPYAIQAANGFYPAKEAKRRTRLRKRQLNGQSNDAYVIGRRVSGSYR